jgi:hydrogenase expression/formation protein HypE
MHDPTEGGVAGALHEMADASKCGFEVEVSHIKIQRETEKICAALGINPLNLIGSGALLITVPERKLDALTSALAKAKVKHFIIGKMTKRKRNLPEVTQDEIWRFV